MKMDYASSSCEGRAHELLAPLTGACPDSVWESICSELEERRLKAKNNWLSKLSNSKTPLMVVGAIVVITIMSWAFFNYKNIQKTEVANTSIPLKQVAKQPVTNSVAPIVKQVAVAENNTSMVNQNAPSQNQSDNSVVVARNEKHKKLADTVENNAVSGKSENIKEDNSPLVIHTNNDGEEPVTSSNVAGGKSVEVKLDRPDESGSNTVINQPSAEITSVADSAQ